MSLSEKPWIGVSDAHRSLLEVLGKAASTEIEVLISGPSGVGKERYARYVHTQGKRASRPFVPLNCGAIPNDLFENELFGHIGGAFTGAQRSAEGVVVQAEGGTLFLDEVDALSMTNQVKLLRFVQEREFRRLGEPTVRRADVRIVAATNADLIKRARERTFREDLLFRLRVFPAYVPPLAERPDDAAALLDGLSDWYAEHYQLPRIQLTPRAEGRLRAYSWPGNVRELENCVRYLTCLRLTRCIDVADLLLIDTAPAPRRLLSGDFRKAKNALVDEFERSYLERALEEADGNISRAARAAGKPRRAFFELMRKHGLSKSQS
jgi:two-component system, NtrC family, response regulator GlrR